LLIYRPIPSQVLLNASFHFLAANSRKSNFRSLSCVAQMSKLRLCFRRLSHCSRTIWRFPIEVFDPNILSLAAFKHIRLVFELFEQGPVSFSKTSA